MEDYPALKVLGRVCREKKLPLIFDRQAYEITGCKQKSRRFFSQHDLPHARRPPAAEFPLVIKPSRGSGSRGIIKVEDEAELEQELERLPGQGDDHLIEEYLEGPAYSLEVIGSASSYYPLMTTELKFDENYDCCRVLAGGVISGRQRTELSRLARRTARNLNLEGIMDIEFIITDSGPRIMEIDARFPSQTPLAVYQAGGPNMVSLLVSQLAESSKNPQAAESGPGIRSEAPGGKAALLEQVLVKRKSDGFEVVAPIGEHVLAEGEELNLRRDFYGADLALTDLAVEDKNKSWRAGLMYFGSNREEIKKRSLCTREKLKREWEEKGGELIDDKT